MTPAYIAGRFVATRDTRTIQNPFGGKPAAEVAFGGAEEIETALESGARAVGPCAALPSHVRAEVCRRISAGIAERARPLADLMLAECGKPISDAENELARAQHTFEIAAAEAERIQGEVIPMDLRPHGEGRLGLTRRFPAGLVVGITPFNFPLNLVAHKVAPALAAGCPILVKPAEQAPATALMLAQIVDGTAWPKGGFQVLPLDRKDASALVEDERPAVVSFTGSTRVGFAIKARAGRKRVVLELGGDAAAIVDQSADVEAALPKLVYGAFSYAGQKCISIQRLLIHARIYDEVRARFLAAAAKVKCGDPRERENLVGPMIDAANADRIENWIAEALAGGARVLLGGPRQGNLVPPTVLEDVPAGSKLATEEAFGPVVILERTDSLAGAIARVNGSRFGLQCGLFTRDLGGALSAFEQIVVGGLIVNDAPSYRIDHMPYGGVKDSGLGREGVRAAIRELTDERLLVVAPTPPQA